jgi:hypothetical protein
MNSSDKANIAGMNCFKWGFRRKHFSQEEIDRLDLPVRFIKDPNDAAVYILSDDRHHK